MQEITVITDLAEEYWPFSELGEWLRNGEVTHVGLWPENAEGPSIVEFLIRIDGGEGEPSFSVIAYMSLALYVKAGTAMMAARVGAP